jgi:hypothetical protein
MSLKAWEQRALDSIKDGLAGSDPHLAALLTTFARLASAEEMPAREMILASPRVKQQWPLLLWLVITAALITVAMTLGHNGGQGTCAGSWPTTCSHSGPG